ncbi:MAG: hypothetical protein ACXADY_17605 [Candidatus Hodarchaeales archaeon]|jgi:hypothetical protein
MQRNSLLYLTIVLIVLGGVSILTGSISLVVPFTVRDPITISGGNNTSTLLLLQANTNYNVKIQVQWLEVAKGSGQLVIRDESQSVIINLDLFFDSEESYGMSSNDFTVPHTGQYSMTFYEEIVSASDPFNIWICEKSFMTIPSEILLILGVISFLVGLVSLVFLEFLGNSSPQFSAPLKAGEKTLNFCFIVFILNLILVLVITLIAIFYVPGYLEELITLPIFMLIYGLSLPLVAPLLGLFGLVVLGFLVLITVVIIGSKGFISRKFGWDEMDEKRYILLSLSILFGTPIFTYSTVFYLKQIIDSSIFSFSKVLKDPFTFSNSLPGLEKIFSAWWFFGLVLPFLLAPIIILWHFKQR